MARIVIADDHGVVVDGLKIALEREGSFQVLACVSDGLAAVSKCEELTPDLILLDISMPRLNGIEATRRIRHACPGVKVICLSLHGEGVYIKAALEAGAHAYVLKDNPLDEVLNAIRAVMAGQHYLCAAATKSMIKARRKGGAVPSAVQTLTAREREVLRLVAAGHTTRQIAGQLRVSPRTVSAHRQSLMDKLRIHNAAGLTRFVMDHWPEVN
jgi:DNA-binding NarL/FixJ family response regulator